VYLTNDQKLWLLTAHPDTWEMGAAPDREVVVMCLRQDLIRVGDSQDERWKLTAKGGVALRDLRGLHRPI
jgi:hypothetical protein